MLSMEPKGDRMLLQFNIPSRGIIGLEIIFSQLLLEAIMSHRFIRFYAL